MAKDLLKSWAIGVTVTLSLYVLVWVTPLALGAFFLFPFAVLADSWAFRLAGGSALQTPLFVALGLALGGVYYGVIAWIVLRYRARSRQKGSAAAGVQ